MSIQKTEWFGFVYFQIVIVILTILSNVTLANFDSIFPDPIIQVSELSITGKRYLPGARWPLITEPGSSRQLSYGLDLALHTNLLSYFYWNNTIVSMTDQFQFRSVAYKFEIGVRIMPCLSLEYGHNSQHILDGIYPSGYPIYDYIGIKLNIVNSSKDKTIFWYFDSPSY